MVPLAGLEPARLAALDFESSASTNFTTGAQNGSAALRLDKQPGARNLQSENWHRALQDIASGRSQRLIAWRASPIAQGFGNMNPANAFGLAKICDRPSDAQDPGVAACGQSHGFCRLRQQFSSRFVWRCCILKQFPVRFTIGSSRRARVTSGLQIARCPDAIRDSG